LLTPVGLFVHSDYYIVTFTTKKKILQGSVQVASKLPVRYHFEKEIGGTSHPGANGSADKAARDTG